MRRFPPELGPHEFFPLAAGTFAVETLVVLAFVVPMATSVVHFLGVIKALPMAQGLQYAAVIAVTAVALGALLQQLRWGRMLELLRLGAVGPGFAALPQWFGFDAPLALRAAVLLAAAGSALWLLRQQAPSTVQGAAA